MSAHAVPAYPMVSEAFRERLLPTVAIGFSSMSGLPPGPREVTTRRFAFGSGTDWDAHSHDLQVKLELTEPALLADLFGPQGVVGREATVAVVCEWTSQDSGRRQSLASPRLDAASLRHARAVSFSVPFPGGEVRGTIRLMLQLVLLEPGGASEGEMHFARVPGTKLGPLCFPYELVLDGNGSLFPIREMQLGSNGPLWRLEAAWDDPAWDDFSPEMVAMEVNRDHPSFLELKGVTDIPYRTSLFRQSVAAWLTLLLWRLREETLSEHAGAHGGPLWDAIISGARTEFLGGSIADAAWLFISRGALATGSPEELMESAQRWVDSAFREI